MNNKIFKVLMELCKEEAVMEGRTLSFVIRTHLENEVFTDNKEIADYMYALVVGQTDLLNFLISVTTLMVIHPELRKRENIVFVRFISRVICKDMIAPKNCCGYYGDMEIAWSALGELADGFSENIENILDPIGIICNHWDALFDNAKTYECIALVTAVRGIDYLKETDTAIYEVRRIITSIARYWGKVDGVI